MPANLIDVVAYILKHYPIQSELSNFRVTKMIYLSDWLSARRYERQITEIKWFYDNFGPFVWDIKDTVEKNEGLIKVEHTKNTYGDDKLLFILKDKNYKSAMTKEDTDMLDYVIDATKKLYSADFVNLVYSTYPILTSEKYTYLDLVGKAKEYKELKNKSV